MGYGGQLDKVFPQGHEDTEWRMRVLGVDEAFLDTYSIKLVAGRDFDPLTFSTDTTQAFILNETAVRQLGWAKNGDMSGAVGKAFDWTAGGHEDGRVIGVVKDFNNRSLREEIRSVVISMWIPKLNSLSLKIRGDRIEETESKRQNRRDRIEETESKRRSPMRTRCGGSSFRISRPGESFWVMILKRCISRN
jgi:hypothetical protein